MVDFDKIGKSKRKTQDAVENGASAASDIDINKRLPIDGAQAGAQASAQRGDPLQPVANVDDIADDLASGEFVKKPELMSLGTFNLVNASKRMNTYRGKTKEQITFECQLLDGENRGARVLCSFDTNHVRDRYFNAVHKYGGVGPLVLLKAENKADSEGAYVFAKPGTVLESGRIPF